MAVMRGVALLFKLILVLMFISCTLGATPQIHSEQVSRELSKTQIELNGLYNSFGVQINSTEEKPSHLFVQTPGEPVVGIVYFFHIPKCGGSSIDSYAKKSPHIEHYQSPMRIPEAQSAKLAEFVEDLPNRRNLLLFEQHPGPELSQMEWLLPLRDEIRAQGYFFDIFVLVRDPIDYTLSTYNYYSQMGEKMPPFEEWVTTVSNMQSLYMDTGQGLASQIFTYRPWEYENGTTISNFSSNNFMKRHFDFLDQMDYVGITSRVNDILTYFGKRCNINIAPGKAPVNISTKLFFKENITVEMWQQHEANNFLDNLLVEHAHGVSSQRIADYTQFGWDVAQTGTSSNP